MPVRFAATVAFDLKAYYPERVPATGGVLMLSNHQSYLDPPLLGTRLNRAMAYLARSGLFVGISSGAKLVGALRVERQTSNAIVVVVFCDGGEKYLSERFWDETAEGER